MKLVLMGAPGAGKGTQAQMLKEELKVPHISTGEIFRDNIKKGTELGKKAKEFMDRGDLVPDNVTIGLVENRIKEDDCSAGFILDGFPRTVKQAENLDRILEKSGDRIDCVLNIEIPDEKIVKRLSGRRVCKHCGKTYHMSYSPPEKDGLCDLCDDGLIQRKDDRVETIRERLNNYHRQTKPLIGYYREMGILKEVDGQGSIEGTFESLKKMLGVNE